MTRRDRPDTIAGARDGVTSDETDERRGALGVFLCFSLNKYSHSSLNKGHKTALRTHTHTWLPRRRRTL